MQTAPVVFFFSVSFSLIKLLVQTTDPDETFYIYCLRSPLTRAIIIVTYVQSGSHHYRIKKCSKMMQNMFIQHPSVTSAVSEKHLWLQ